MNIYFSSFSKHSRLDDLSLATQHCTLCSRMCHRSKILSHANGNPDSKIIFVAEAPGRLGADRTGLPLHGDKTGDNFEKLLGAIGWTRDSIFITNAVLCNPREENGTNGTPNKLEIKQCSVYLEMTLNLVQPEIIVTLGRVALESLSYIFPHEISLANDVGKLVEWNGYNVFPVYHPSPRAIVYRSFSKQTADFILLSKKIDPLGGMQAKLTNTKKNSSKKPTINELLKTLITIITESLGELSYFKLNKLLYLIDLKAINEFGQSITGEIYLRQQEGPWLPKIRELLTQMDGYEIIHKFYDGKPYVAQGHKPRMCTGIDDGYKDLINNIITKYGNNTDSEIKSVVYTTQPMRYILRAERKGEKMVNKPVIYKDKTIVDISKGDIRT